MNRVVLIQPPVRDFYLTRKRTLPYGLAAIAAGLEAAGFACTIIDGLATDKSKTLPLPEEFSYLQDYYGREDLSLFSLFSTFRHFGYTHEHLGHLARQEQPFIVGISSLFTPYADQAMATAAAVRKFCPGAWIVLGGHHPTLFPGQCLSNPDIDFLIRGEGETALVELCRFLNRGNFTRGNTAGIPDFSKVPGMGNLKGLAYRSQGKVICNPPAWEPDLNALPLPAVDKTHAKFYRRGQKKAVTIAASRGCPFSCSYCSVSARTRHGRFRRRSVDNVLAEIRSQAKNHPIGFIDFEDENLTLDKKWVLSLLSGITEIFKDRSVELRAMNGLFPPSLDKEIILAMKAAGFKTLNLSVGSFSASQLARFGRPDVRKSYEDVLEIALEAGMDTVSYIIAAAPDQTAQTTLEDLLTLASLPTLAGLSVFYPAPGSVDFERCRNYGILPERFELMRSSALPLTHTTDRVQAVTLLRLSRLINFMKFCTDTTGSLPTVQPFNEAQAGQLFRIDCNSPISPEFRFKISKALAGWFLNDGIIRGMDRSGTIYEHATDKKLSEQFTATLKSQNRFMGVTTGPWSF